MGKLMGLVLGIVWRLNREGIGKGWKMFFG